MAEILGSGEGDRGSGTAGTNSCLRPTPISPTAPRRHRRTAALDCSDGRDCPPRPPLAVCVTVSVEIHCQYYVAEPVDRFKAGSPIVPKMLPRLPDQCIVVQRSPVRISRKQADTEGSRELSWELRPSSKLDAILPELTHRQAIHGVPSVTIAEAVPQCRRSEPRLD
jgi:hypothetical protein